MKINVTYIVYEAGVFEESMNALFAGDVPQF